MMQAITTTGLDTRSQSFGFALSIRKAAVPPVGIVEDCSQPHSWSRELTFPRLAAARSPIDRPPPSATRASSSDRATIRSWSKPATIRTSATLGLGQSGTSLPPP